MDAETPPRSIAGHLREAWRTAAKFALDIALPTLCVSCREPVEGEGVCAECWAKLSFIEPPYCPRLGIPFVYDPGPELLSMEAIANPPAYQRARAAVRYDDVARTLVHALKYHDRTDLAPTMGRWMARAGRELLAEADVLVPVLRVAEGQHPIEDLQRRSAQFGHRRNRRQRGFERVELGHHLGRVAAPLLDHARRCGDQADADVVLEQR